MVPFKPLGCYIQVTDSGRIRTVQFVTQENINGSAFVSQRTYENGWTSRKLGDYGSRSSLPANI